MKHFYVDYSIGLCEVKDKSSQSCRCFDFSIDSIRSYLLSVLMLEDEKKVQLFLLLCFIYVYLQTYLKLLTDTFLFGSMFFLM